MSRLRATALSALLLLGAGSPGWSHAQANDGDRAPAPTLYTQALDAYRKGALSEAASLLESAIAAGEDTAGHRALLGWCRLRSGDLGAAAGAFRAALEHDPEAADAMTGLGFVMLRNQRFELAESHFRDALEGNEASGDAWKGLGLALRGRGDLKGAREALRRAAQAGPDDAETARLLQENLSLILDERRPRPAAPSTKSLELVSRTGPARLEIRNGERWEPLFVKGVNLGTALPGRFPAEFPDDPDLYRDWFDRMGDMGANVVRLYTLHPPSLYRALHEHNRDRPQQKLWLVQGVWTELPPGDDFGAPEFEEAFHDEIRRVIDAVHGNLELPVRPGHADGVYDADLSRDLLAWLLGREWEPFAVEAYNDSLGQSDGFDGDYVQTASAMPIESWLASVCDVAARHETEYYRWQHPIGVTSWPTLDPLVHPTEATVEEEMVVRGKVGRLPEKKIREYDNDKINVDFTRIRATPEMRAGLYASYHAYPYYPDFMIHEKGIADERDVHGVSRYLGYLKELARHHGDQPVLIAEIGVPTSRGIAHLHPEGQHHGGHDEASQGFHNVRLMQNIDEAGLAGGILFAWMDEWFKRNWVVKNFESPPERNPLWHNALDAEQHYGLLAALPGESGWKIVLDGSADDWAGIEPLYEETEGPLRTFRVTSDEAYLYLALEIDGPADPFAPQTRYWLGIDTYGRERGSRRLPPPAEIDLPIGLEFLVEIHERSNSRILVDRGYDLFSNRNRRPYRSKPNDRADFVEIEVYTNRDRFGRDGTFYPARGYSRSPLRHGSTDRLEEDFDSLADMYASPGRIEIRIPWGLLNIADPSSRRVIHETRLVENIVETVGTEGFRFHLLALRDGREGPVVIGSLPADPGGPHPLYTWPTWEAPTYRLELKQSYFMLQDALPGIPAR